MGIEVIPPCVNKSGSDFTVKDGKIHFGFAAVKGCGSAGEALERERKEEGPFSSIYDLCERVGPAACGATALKCLVSAGALDCFGFNRAELTNSIDKAIEYGKKKQADREAGQLSLFGQEEEEVEVELERCADFEERELLNMEKEVLGFYLSSHPLAEYKDQLALHCSHKTTELTGLKDRAKVRMGGMLSSLKHAHTKNGRPGAPTKYVNFDLEDVDGAVRCILWPDDYVNHGHLVEPDAIVLIVGAIDRRGDEPNLIVNEIIPLDQVEQRYTSGVIIRVDEAKHESNVLPRIREVVRGFPGDRDLELLVCLRNGSRVRMKSQRMQVEVNGELQSRVDHLLGPGNFKIITRRE